jgi:hypothetical protein
MSGLPETLERLQTEVADGLETASKALGAVPRDMVEASLAATLRSIGLVTSFAADLAGTRLAEAERVLDRMEGHFETRVGETREGLLHTAARARETLDGVEEGSGDLRETADGSDADTALLAEETQTRAAATGTVIEQTGMELEAMIQQSETYIGDGLVPWLNGVFGVLRAHLEEEAQPYLTDTLTVLAANVARFYDDFQAVLETASSSVVDTTETEFANATDEAESLLDEHRGNDDHSAAEFVEPLREELARNNSLLVDGNGIVNNLAPLIPLLVSAKHVINEIDQMLHFSME